MSMATMRVVLCIGDSHTHGVAGASFVAKLQARNRHLHFVAAGIDGQPTESIAKRVPKLLQQYPNPAAILLLGGTNDCLEQQNQSLHLFYSIVYRITEPCTQAVSLKNIAFQLDTIKQSAPDTKVIVITLPPLTEQPAHPAFLRVQEFNAALKQLVAKAYPDVHIADFYSSCIQHLEKHAKPQQAQQQQQLYSFSIPSVLLWQPTAVFQHYLFFRSWNSISRSRGLQLLTDQVHINDTAAELLVGEVQPLLKDVQ